MGLVAVVLAAGAGTRLRPLTELRPKALCPVGNVPLVDLAIERVRRLTEAVAVNVCHGRSQMEAHLAGRAHLSIEEPAPLGTAGALGRLREWIAGRAVFVHNADSWHAGDLRALTEGWDGARARLLVVEDRARPDFDGRWRYAGACLLPTLTVERLPVAPAGLFHQIFAPEHEAGRLDLVVAAEAFFDCGAPDGYHAANMAASGGRNVVGEGARVEGEIVRCVVWPGAVVARGERLVDAIRADGLTVQV